MATKKSIIKATIGGITMTERDSKFGGKYMSARVGVYVREKDGSERRASVWYNGKNAVEVNAKYKAGDYVAFEGKLTASAPKQNDDGTVSVYYNIVGMESNSPAIKHIVREGSLIGD